MKTENIIQTKTFEFSLSIIKLYKDLVSNKEFVISNQLLRSATSIGANIEEALAAQSRRDFLSKMSIASKEARETHYWLRLIDASNLYVIPCEIFDAIINIKTILTSIVKTTSDSIKN